MNMTECECMKWTRVQDGLPEPGVQCWVCVQEEDVEPYMDQASVDEDGLWYDWVGDYQYGPGDVTHWMKIVIPEMPEDLK